MAQLENRIAFITGGRPSAHEAVQNGKISVSIWYFAVLHWAICVHTAVKMANDAANEGSFFEHAAYSNQS
jgi:hypothetical protein